MAETHTGEAYYDAGTINEQLDEYEVYEVDGKLYLNNEAGDSDDFVAFDGVAQLLGAPRSSAMTDADLEDGRTALYVRDDDGVALYAAYNDGGSVTEVQLAEFVAPAT